MTMTAGLLGMLASLPIVGPSSARLRNFLAQLTGMLPPVADDVVVETGGVRPFLDPGAADGLDDAELVVEDGDLALALRRATGGGDT